MNSGSLLANISASILTPATILWMVAAFVATTLVFGAINRRRGRLTDSLTDYVDHNQMKHDSATGSGQKKTQIPNKPNPE
jgi:preprotein translocase subunit SecG